MIEILDIQIQKIKESKLKTVDFENLVFGRTFSDHMFVADYLDGQWQNLEIQPYNKIAMSPSLMALHYGQSIFEGMKAYRTEDNEIVLFRPYENLMRMNTSATRMCMPVLPEEVFIGAMSKLIQLDKNWVPKSQGATLYIRPFMFASDEYIGMRASDNYKFIIFTCPVAAYYNQPVRVKIETHYVRAAEGGMGSAKTCGNYAASLYPAKLAQEQGYDQLIWTDSKEHRFIEESGTMNLMFKIAGKILTAPIGDTILDGVTRKSVLQIAADWGLKVEERRISVDEVMEAIGSGKLEEAFGVGTAAMVSPIRTIAYQNTDYDLKPMTEEGFGLKAKKYLTDLCKGRVEDTHNWLFRIS